MRSDFSLAAKMVFRRKKRTVLLFICIFTLLLTTSAVTVIEQNTAARDQTRQMMDYGNWQVAFFACGNGAKEQALHSGVCSAATEAYRLNKAMIDGDSFSLDLTLSDPDGFAMMARYLTSGRYPCAANEIIVDDWYLAKQKIRSLPAEVSAGGTLYHIVGAFRSSKDDLASETVRAFGSADGNRELLEGGNLSAVPVDNNYFVDENPDGGNGGKPFLLIRIRESVSLPDAVHALEKCSGISPFSGTDQLKLTPQKDQTPYYNVNLIAAQGLKGAQAFRNLSPSSQSGNRDRMVEFTLFAVLFVAVFLSMNIVAGGSIREFGLISAVGLEPRRIGFIVAFQAVFLAAVSVVPGVFAGAGGAWLILRESAAAAGGPVQIPWAKLCLDCLAGFTAVAAASLYPAWKASRRSPLSAIDAVPGMTADGIFHGPNLTRIKSKWAFPIRFGLKSACEKMGRTALIVLSVALLLAAFTHMTREIEIEWKIGSGREAEKPDYTVEVPYIDYTNGMAYNEENV